jgi:hypothetical protein
LAAWSIVGNRSISSPSLHARSLQLSQRSLSVCGIRFAARLLADYAARMLAIARD